MNAAEKIAAIRAAIDEFTPEKAMQIVALVLAQ